MKNRCKDLFLKIQMQRINQNLIVRAKAKKRKGRKKNKDSKKEQKNRMMTK